MKANHFTILALMLIFGSCGNRGPESLLIGKWDFRNVFNPNNESSEYDKEIGNQEIDDLLNPNFYGSYYVLNEDHTFNALHTEGKGGYIEGKWEYTENDSVLHFYTNSDIQEKSFKVNYMEKDNISFSDIKTTKVNPHDSYINQLAANINHRYKFVRDDYTLESDENYTLRKYNNFRIKPKKAESKLQILERVKQSFEYAILYIKNNKEQDKNSINLHSIILPVGFYSNGFVLKHFEECINWEQLFYNKEQAMIGYKIVSNAMSADLKVPNNKNPIDLNLYLLEELYKTIK